MRDETTVGSKEASEILRVDRATFLRWVDKGLIEPIHENPGPSGAKVFRRADVLKLAAQKASA